MKPITFNREFDPEYGSLVPVTALIRRLVARNSGDVLAGPRTALRRAWLLLTPPPKPPQTASARRAG